MPDSPYSGGFNLAVEPQYNPAPAQNFVLDRGAAVQGFGQGLNLAGQIATFAPVIGAKIAQAKLQNAQDSANLDNAHAEADANLAKAKYEKSLANLGSQRNDFQADALDRAHNVLQGVTAAAGALGAGQNVATPNTADASAPAQPQSTINIAAQQQPVNPSGIGNIAVSGTTAQPSSAGTNGVPQQFQVAASAPNQQPSNQFGLSPDKIQQLSSILTPDQALDLAGNIRAAQTPSGQAQIAKLYADVGETVGRGNYYNSFAQLKNAQSQNILTTGGRYGLQNLILSNFVKNGGDPSKAFDLDSFNQDSQDAVKNGEPPPEITDYINKDGLAAEQARIDALKSKGVKPPAAAPPAAIQSGLSDGSIYTDGFGQYYYTQSGKPVTPVVNGTATPALGGLPGASPPATSPSPSPSPGASPPAVNNLAKSLFGN